MEIFREGMTKDEYFAMMAKMTPDEAQTVMKRFHSDDEADTFLHKLFERRVDTQRMETADEFWEMLEEAPT